MEKFIFSELTKSRETSKDKDKIINALQLENLSLKPSWQGTETTTQLNSGDLEQKMALELKRRKERADLTEEIKSITTKNEMLKGNLVAMGKEIDSIKRK
jgi:hypothetical protein